jgi:rod shape-determining protein MreC
MEHEELSKNRRLFVFLIFFSCFLILGDFFGVWRPVKGFVEEGIGPIREGVYRVKQDLVSIFSFFSFWRSGTVKIAHLEEKVRELAAVEGEVASLREENEKMKKLLGVPLPKDWKFLPAKAIGKNGELFIDKGLNDDVAEGMMVVSENILVGKVEKTGTSSSKILLPSSREAKIPAKVIRSGQEVGKGVLVGSADEKIFLEKVLQKEEIKEKDLVVTTGESDYLPDLLVGEIERIERKEADVFQRAQVAPLLNYGELETVFVVMESK